MPSGTYITVGFGCTSPEECCLDVAVYSLVQDFYLTEGLCGDYNGYSDDDLTLIGYNGNVEPFEFAYSYL